MTKKEFMMGYLEAEARIRLKKAQAEGEFPSEALASEIAELEAKRKAVVEAIESAPKAEMRMVLEALYINGMTYEQAAFAVGYGERNMYILRRKAFEAMKFPAGVA